MDIFFCINDAYVRQLCVAMVSVLENNRRRDIRFHILSGDLSDESKNKIEKLKIKYKNFGVDYAAPDTSLFKGLENKIDYIPGEAWYRYAIADMFPNIGRALYLDADLVVNKNLDRLYGADLDGYYAAGVVDKYVEKINHKHVIGLAPNDLYVNSGVLLLNLEKIREDGMTEKLFESARDNMDRIKFPDQDGLNIAFCGKIKELPFKFNYTERNFKSLFHGFLSAVIIHFTGSVKPWHETPKCSDFLRRPGKFAWRGYAKISDRICK
jgi:lipopolysaccharide biosynthesis glycosyltransferase